MASRRKKVGSRKRFPVLALFVVLAAAAAAGIGITVSNKMAAANQPSAPSAQQVTTTTVPPPLEFVSSSVVEGATRVAPDATISLSFSAPVSPSSAMPTFSPLVQGSWTQNQPGVLTFTPTQSFVPYTKEVLTIPGGQSGVLSAQGQPLAGSQTISFTVAPGSVLRLQQLLAELGYLPLNFAPQNSTAVPLNQMALPESGSFTWKWSALPASLTSLWAPGTMNVVTKGAVMQFENQHGLSPDGIAGPAVWSHLLAAVVAGKTDSAPYDYVTVTKALPEHVTVYSNGTAAYTTLANTGVPAAQTVNGTFPVYLRYRSTTMKGVNPNGTTYDDHNVPWVSYFNGSQGLHGFIRPGYGYPQSDGCVEMPIANAAKVWPLTPIGTLVTVE